MNMTLKRKQYCRDSEAVTLRRTFIKWCTQSLSGGSMLTPQVRPKTMNGLPLKSGNSGSNTSLEGHARDTLFLEEPVL